MSRRPGRPLVLPLHALLELLEHLSVALGLLLFVKLFQILLGVVLKVGFVNYVVTLGVALVLLRLIVEEVVVLILFCLFAFSPEVYGPEILFLPIFLLLGCTLVLLPHELSLGCQHLSSCASVIHQLVSLHRSIVSIIHILINVLLFLSRESLCQLFEESPILFVDTAAAGTDGPALLALGSS